MAMDDPWGSPWADEIQLPVKHKASTSLALEQKTSSPWGDGEDDGFGDWAGASAEDGHGLGLDDGCRDDAERALGSTHDRSNTLPTLGNGLAITPKEEISKLSPGPIPNPNTLRHPSPDPWAIATNGKEELVQAAPLPTESHNYKEAIRNEIIGLGIDKETSTGAAPKDVPYEPLPESKSEHSAKEGVNSIAEVSNTSADSAESEAATPIRTLQQFGPIQEAYQEVSSRPSSSPSEHSHHGDVTQDSPRTSLDEEPKRPWVQRKVSTKVQEIVEKFEGLAQQEITGPVVKRAETTDEEEEGGNGEGDEEDEMDEFGDFEDVHSEAERPMDNDEARSFPKPHDVEAPNSTSGEMGMEDVGTRRFASRKDLGPVEFPVDTSPFDRLYSGSETTPLDTVFIPDIVPHDSFSSTGERKTWYRISRYGTLRKYNSGDDENYVRVSWMQSQVRTDTLKIVARWIEEDRINGRVLLGGASKGSSIFGWGDAKTIPLSHAFAAKNGKQKQAIEPVVEIPREWPQGLVRTRSTSRTPSLSKAPRNGSIQATVSEKAKHVAQAPVANFGWNSALHNEPKMPSQSTAHGKNPAPQTNLNHNSYPLPIQRIETTIPTTEASPRPYSLAHTNILAPQPLNTSNFTDNSDNDDWGELISSPSSNIAPVASSPMGPGRKLIGSLHSAFPSKSPLSRLTGQHSHPLTTVHPWSMRSDESLKRLDTGPMATKSTSKSVDSPLIRSNNNHLDIAFSPAAEPVSRSLTTAGDPWASADLSFFETIATPISKVPPALVTKPVPEKSVTSSGSAVTSSPRRSQKSGEEVEQDRIVQGVIKGLPDFSYMLRR